MLFHLPNINYILRRLGFYYRWDIIQQIQWKDHIHLDQYWNCPIGSRIGYKVIDSRSKDFLLYCLFWTTAHETVTVAKLLLLHSRHLLQLMGRQENKVPLLWYMLIMFLIREFWKKLFFFVVVIVDFICLSLVLLLLLFLFCFLFLRFFFGWSAN